MAPFASPVESAAGPVVAPREVATYSILTVPIADPQFRPSKPLSPLPGALTTVPKALLARMAREYNASDFAAKRKRWLVVQIQGGIVELFNIPEEDRPTDPNALPFVLRSGLEFEEAQTYAGKVNAWMLDLCRVPKQWQVVALELGSVQETEQPAAPAKTEGGAA